MLRSRGVDVIEHVVDNHQLAGKSKLIAGIRSVWNADEQSRIRSIIEAARPDILKVDNYFPILSPSIFAGAKSIGVPTILSIRNYRLICPAATLFRDGRVCMDCVNKRFAIPAVQHRCYRRSYLQSSAVVLSNAYAQFRKVWVDSVDHFIAVSESTRQLLIQGGIRSEKISVKPNSVVDTGPGDGAGDYAIYVGRLTAEKGVMTLLEAWQQIGKRVRLKVVGTGPLEDKVRQAASEVPSIEYAEQKSLAEVCEYLGKARVLIFPSIWMEPFGRTIVEAYSKGTPVIAADTEPMRQMIQDGRTGVLFRAGDSGDLVRKVLDISTEKEKLSRMRQQSRARYLEMYSEETCYAKMMQVFNKVLGII